MRFCQQGDWLCIELADNGRGVNEKQTAETERLGIQGVRERVELLGGRFTLSPASRQGTLLRVEIPLTKETPL
ncbi:ATP-binding protein [Anaeromusa sp.]|uniref:ATP-binding protein n=1 Tax=Anaeromusa sp. TaxID=1872520 RepID=UPI00341CA89B